MKMIYVVTKGEYSDYGIIGVFEDKDVAAEFAAQMCGEVEDYKVKTNSDMVLPPNFRRYEIYMCEDGSTLRVSIRECDMGSDYADTKVVINPSLSFYYVYTGGYVFFVDTNKGETGAIKIANERRVQMIANGKWPQKGSRAIDTCELD
jgi:hypothetical protein